MGASRVEAGRVGAGRVGGAKGGGFEGWVSHDSKRANHIREKLDSRRQQSCHVITFFLTAIRLSMPGHWDCETRWVQMTTKHVAITTFQT